MNIQQNTSPSSQKMVLANIPSRAHLIGRIDAALKRIDDGPCYRRIPADPTDVDLVLAECKALIEGQWPPFWIAGDAAEQARAEPQPNLLWDNDDPEQYEKSINDVLVSRYKLTGLAVGDVVTIQQAVRLPNIDVRITSLRDAAGYGGLEWTVIGTEPPSPNLGFFGATDPQPPTVVNMDIDVMAQQDLIAAQGIEAVLS